MYRIAICEDEPHIREELCALCAQVLQEAEIPCALTTFNNAEELSDVLAAPEGEAPFDLLLLDIQLGGKTGLELAKERRLLNDRVSIIFITSCEEYLLEGYSVQPIQFLLKPVGREALAQALRTDWRLHHADKRVTLRDGSRTVVFSTGEVRYIESLNHGIVVHLTDAQRSYRISLADAESALPPGCFCRCHNSFLVNMAHIGAISRTEVVLNGGERIPIGRKYYADAQRALIRYINQ